MASKFVKQDGKYNQKVPDSGDGQSKSKFSNPLRPIKDSGKHKYSQKIGTPMDSKQKLG